MFRPLGGQYGASQVPRRAIPWLCGRSLTPDGPWCLACRGASGAVPAIIRTRTPTLWVSRLNGVASPPAVYASRRTLPHAMQHALPAGGLRLCRAGVEPTGSQCKVSAHSLLPARTCPSAILSPYITRDETSRYTDLLFYGRSRLFGFVMDVKSVITYPSERHRLSAKDSCEIRGLTWSSRGSIARVEASLDAGGTSCDAELQEPRLPRAFARSRFPWRWDGSEHALQPEPSTHRDSRSRPCGT